MDKSSPIFVAGSTGLVGSAITTELKERGYHNLLLPSHRQLDLLDQAAVNHFFEQEKPHYLFLAAAKVGGIMANHIYRGQFIFENLQIQNNIIHSAWKHGVKKLLFLGSSCIYPRDCPQPMKEEHLLTSPLEYTNEPYAIAKIAGIKMCESYNLQYGTDFIAVMPTNLYGQNDNYNLKNSHVLPALIRKMHLGKMLMAGDWDGIRRDLHKHPMEGVDPEADKDHLVKVLEEFGIFRLEDNVEIRLWGTGKPRREFLHARDLAKAVVFIMEKISFSDVVRERGLKEVRNTHINIGSGEDLAISELANLVKRITGFKGILNWDPEKPDGTYQKLMDISRLKALGWQPEIALEAGIEKVYHDYGIQ